LLKLLALLAASVDSSVIPDRDRLMTGERPQHNPESCQLFSIRMTVADEDLGALWGSHQSGRLQLKMR
jgi:hypothetical protein